LIFVPQQPSYEDLAALIAVQARVIAELRAEVAEFEAAVGSGLDELGSYWWSGCWIPDAFHPTVVPAAVGTDGDLSEHIQYFACGSNRTVRLDPTSMSAATCLRSLPVRAGFRTSGRYTSSTMSLMTSSSTVLHRAGTDCAADRRDRGPPGFEDPRLDLAALDARSRTM